jgi:flagellar hook-basal body complex protein FliE
MDKFDSDMVIEDLVRLYNMKGDTPPLTDSIKSFSSSSAKNGNFKERQKSLPSIAESSDDEYDNIVKKIKDTDVIKKVLKNTINSVNDTASRSRKSLTAFQKNTEKRV